MHALIQKLLGESKKYHNDTNNSFSSISIPHPLTEKKYLKVDDHIVPHRFPRLMEKILSLRWEFLILDDPTDSLKWERVGSWKLEVGSWKLEYTLSPHVSKAWYIFLYPSTLEGHISSFRGNSTDVDNHVGTLSVHLWSRYIASYRDSPRRG